jgi:hypothetical protein
MTRPGVRLRSLAARICSDRAMQRVVDPAIADLQHEYETAAREGLRWEARLTLCGGYVALAKVLSLCVFRAVFTNEAKSTTDAAVRRSAGIALLAFACFTLLLVLPPLADARIPERVSTTAYIVVLIPQAVPVAIPIALSLGILCGLRGRDWAPSVVWSVIGIGAIGCVVSLSMVEWVIPAANQAWREMMASASGRTIIVRGAGESSLSELFTRADPLGVQMFHNRAAVCVAAISCSVLALALAPFVQRIATAAVSALGFAVAYVGCAWIVDWISPVMAPWITNILFVGLGVLVIGLRRNRAKWDVSIDGAMRR